MVIPGPRAKALSGTVVHLAPHPDDELIGAPATLLALRDAGWRILNVACGLGFRRDWARRRAELVEACRHVGFDLHVARHPLPDREDPGADAVGADELVGLIAEVVAVVRDVGAVLVVAPSPHDRHPDHEAVGRVAMAALRRLVTTGASGGGEAPVPVPRLWLWGLWGDLPFPTILTPVAQPRLEEIESALAAHVGELDRNDYRQLLRGRGLMNASLGPEKAFGFGTAPRLPAGVDVGGGGNAVIGVELVSEVVLRERKMVARAGSVAGRGAALRTADNRRSKRLPRDSERDHPLGRPGRRLAQGTGS